MRLYREYARQKFMRWGNMTPIDELGDLLPGYAGLYAYDEEDALLIKSSRSSKGLKRFKPWADRLTVDIDDSVDDMKHNVEVLVDAGYMVRLFKSGGTNSFHIEVPHADGWVGHSHLPYSHRRVVQDLGLRCDMCLYQHGRIFRMEGMVHEKTGRTKTLLKEIPGNLIEVPIVPEPEKQFYNVQNDPDELGYMLMDIACRISNQPVPGERHNILWGISCDLFRSGMSYEAVLGFASAVNQSWKDAKPFDEVERAVHGAAVKERVMK